MRDISWKFFTLTGSIDAYMLYKEHEDKEMQFDNEEQNQAEDDVYSQ